MNTLQEFIEGHGGVANVTFVVPMRPMWVPFASNDDVPIDMHIIDHPDDNNHSLAGGYKVDLLPANPKLVGTFGSQSFYQSDLLGMVRDGTIKVKITETIA